jgi:hypothetical protein
MSKSESNVVDMFNPFEPYMTVDGVLETAGERGLSTVVVLGYTPDGKLYVSSSGDVTRRDALWIIEMAKMAAILGEEE